MTLVTLLVALPPVGAAPPPDYANRPFDYAHDAEGSGTGGWRSNDRRQRWDNEWDYVVRQLETMTWASFSMMSR